MNNSLFNFRDDEEREMFLVAIPVMALFGLLGFWLMKGDSPEPVVVTTMASVADTDGDGITDTHDQCVTISGAISSYGCPEKISWAERDNDTDGIRNGIDSCPETHGVASNNGCAAEDTAEPVKFIDSDNDGIEDATDNCPDEAGVNGSDCPAVTESDRDADGVIDSEDKCPDTAGSPEASGCVVEVATPEPAAPVKIDTDKDGFTDDIDQCPDVAGPAITNGCPADTDGDGVIDLQDACPTVTAETDDGCPVDTDGDGITDNIDDCPTLAGFEGNNGCPADTDNDGIADADDQCPAVDGNGSESGCPVVEIPDGDNDGIADSEDNCPTIPGVAEMSGCPLDSDGDGLIDVEDDCPTLAGDATLSGCPANAEPDPDEVERVLSAAITGVKFNSSSVVLTARSQQILRTVAGLMNKYPDSILEIRGHTDASGNSVKNMELSLERARACATFIAGEGISNDRLKAYGLGDTQPLVSNDTAVGRERNRRVEFNLQY